MRDWIFIGTTPSMRLIAQTIAEKHGVTMDELRGPSRKRRIAWPRQEAIATIVTTGRTQSQAARFLNRSFWTAKHSVEAVEARALAKQEAA